MIFENMVQETTILKNNNKKKTRGGGGIRGTESYLGIWG